MIPMLIPVVFGFETIRISWACQFFGLNPEKLRWRNHALPLAFFLKSWIMGLQSGVHSIHKANPAIPPSIHESPTPKGAGFCSARYETAASVQPGGTGLCKKTKIEK